MGVVPNIVKRAASGAKEGLAGMLLAKGAETGNPVLCKLAFGHASPEANTKALALAANAGHVARVLTIMMPAEVKLGRGYDFSDNGQFSVLFERLATDPKTQPQVEAFVEGVGVAIWRQGANTNNDQGRFAFMPPV